MSRRTQPCGYCSGRTRHANRTCGPCRKSHRLTAWLARLDAQWQAAPEWIQRSITEAWQSARRETPIAADQFVREYLAKWGP